MTVNIELLGGSDAWSLYAIRRNLDRLPLRVTSCGDNDIILECKRGPTILGRIRDAVTVLGVRASVHETSRRNVAHEPVGATCSTAS